MRRSRQFVIAVVALAAGLGLLPSSAGADDFGYPNPGFVADGADHWYCYGTVTDSDQRTKISDSMAYLDDRTDMYDQFAGSCAGSTDLVWAPVDFGPGQRGQTDCVSWAYWGVCDQYWISFDAGEVLIQSADCSTSPAASYEVNIIKTFRHEIGHSAGLSHGGNAIGCSAPGNDSMRSGWVPTNLTWTTYSDHHRDHINAQY